MIDHANTAMVDWARAQFALTAFYHWLFVPLTLGLVWFLAFFHTIAYRTGSESWRRLTKFWMKLFAVNFAIGVATGIIL
ncbi:cytochrome ubiquinol oxidase subunit I, partial [bacterium]|nr:cytochrome ubiquinol oxidase subunit I [bacterium]